MYIRKTTVYCLISGCVPEVALRLEEELDDDDPRYNEAVIDAMSDIAGISEVDSQNDMFVIGPIHPCGKPYSDPYADDGESSDDDDDAPPPHPETDVRVVPHCVMAEEWGSGCVAGPPPHDEHLFYQVAYGYYYMVQTHALDVMALATHGRMTALRLWRLATEQGLWESRTGLSHRLEGVDYGEISGQEEWGPDPFPGFSKDQINELESIEDVEIVKEWLVHEGKFWVWMAPNRFPVRPTNSRHITPTVSQALSSKSPSPIENLPLEVLGAIALFLPLRALLNFATVSHHMRACIVGNSHLARVWMYNNAPWWIPVPTRTPRKSGGKSSKEGPETHLASEWSPHTPLSVEFPVGLGWSYIGRCMRSGSMRNRRRIWNAALDIERVADLAGV